MPAAFRRILRTILVLALVAVTGLVFPAASPQASAMDETSRVPKVVGSWPRITPTAVATWGEALVVPQHFDDPEHPGAASTGPHLATAGTLVPNLGARQLWQFYPLGPFPTAIGIVVLDVDTGKALATLEVPVLKRVGHWATAGDWVHASDGGRTMYFVTGDQARIVVVDATTFAVRTLNVPPPMALDGKRVVNLGHIVGLTFDPGVEPGAADDALIAYAGLGAAGMPSPNALIRFRLGDGGTDLRIIRSCDGPTVNLDTRGGYLGMPVLATKERFVVPCHRYGYTVLLVALDRATAFVDPLSPEMEVVGPTSMNAVIADQAAGRMHIANLDGELWVFDARSMAFIGVVATAGRTRDPSTSFGFDEVTGRVLFQSPDSGFGVLEGRFFPVPQAIVAPRTAARAAERVVADAATGRAYVLEGVDGTERPTAFKVYDIGKAPAPPSPPDPDRSTADIEEAPGRTESRYFASGSGFGARALLVKGVTPVAPAVGAGVWWTANVFNDHVNSRCGYTDRDLLAGEVAKAEYDTGSTAATASAVDVDDRTKVDLGQASRCDVTVRDSNGTERFSGIFATAPAGLGNGGPGWGYRPASCTSSAEEGEVRSSGDRAEGTPSLGPNEAVCPAPGGVLTASATAELVGAVAVGRAHTDVRIERTAAGVESVVTSTAGDISIAGGIVRIGSIEAEARSLANGRPQRDPMSSHAVRMAHVSVNGQEICGATCDPRWVVDRLRQYKLGRVDFRTVTGRDDELLRGTPKGAQTAVQKSAARQASDRGLLGDTRYEIPAFEVIVYNDNLEYGRARQIYQFAGVASAANYNIVPLPSLASLLDGDDGPTRPDGLSIDTEPVAVSDDGTMLATLPASAGNGSDGGGFVAAIRRAVRAIGEGLALIVTDPRRAFLVLTAWAVIVAPVALQRRRRLLLGART